MLSKELGLILDPNCCGGCQIGLYRSEHGIRNAECCRWCSNIDMLHKDRLKAIEKDKYFENSVYCTKHKLLQPFYEICNYFNNEK